MSIFVCLSVFLVFFSKASNWMVLEDTIVLKKVYNRETITRLSDEEYEEVSLSWDDSPEQYELMPDAEEDKD